MASSRLSIGAIELFEVGVFDAAILHSCAAAAKRALRSDMLTYEGVDDLILKPIGIRESYACPANRPRLEIRLSRP